MSDDQRRSHTAQTRHRVTVLGSFTLSAPVRSDSGGADATSVPLGVDSRRLVAYLAVHPRPQERVSLAADLWPSAPPAAGLRLLADAVSAIDVPGLLVGADDAASPLALASDVEVDLAEAMLLVRALPDTPADNRPEVGLLGADILPGWTAAWIAIERERFRQIRLHALEELSLRLSAAARYEDAIEIAQSAVRTAPSRESARRVLIEAHLAQGNIAAAVAQYDEYQELLRSSVGGPVPTGLEGLLPPTPAWPVLRARRPMQRSAVQLPGLRSVRGAANSPRRLVAGGSLPGNAR